MNLQTAEMLCFDRMEHGQLHASPAAASIRALHACLSSVKSWIQGYIGLPSICVAAISSELQLIKRQCRFAEHGAVQRAGVCESDVRHPQPGSAASKGLHTLTGHVQPLEQDPSLRVQHSTAQHSTAQHSTAMTCKTHKGCHKLMGQVQECMWSL